MDLLRYFNHSRYNFLLIIVLEVDSPTSLSFVREWNQTVLLADIHLKRKGLGIVFTVLDL